MTSPRTAAVRRALTAVVTAVTGAALVVSSLGTGGAAASGNRADWLAGHDHSTHAHKVAPEQAADPNVWHPERAHDHHAAGKVHAGLKESTACPGGFAVEDSTGACSHGPDPAPAGVDVRDIPTVAELRAEAAESLGGGTAAADGAVPCYGDGVSGKRVQVVYAVAGDRTDRYASVVDLIRGYAWNADQAFSNSAARGGGIRHVRWLTDSDCRLSVAHVVLSPTGDDSIANTRTELRNLGYTSNDRKYLVFADAGVYCGISYVAGDDRPDASNPANSGATVSRVDTSCWGGTTSVPAHELAHAIGAVQLTAPHSNGAWHCTDEYDRLCYNDGSGATLTYLCASSQEPLLDCNGDDYFNVAPVPGSWLATHWNLANSLFLETAGPVAPTPPTTTSAPSPTTTTAAPPPTSTTAPPPTTTSVPPPATTSAPPPTTTTSPSPSPSPTKNRGKKPRFATEFSGKLTSSRRTRTFRVAADTGTLKSLTRFRGTNRLRLVVRDASGDMLLDKRLRSGRAIVQSVDGGRYQLTVQGRGGTRFRLKVVRSL